MGCDQLVKIISGIQKFEVNKSANFEMVKNGHCDTGTKYCWLLIVGL